MKLKLVENIIVTDSIKHILRVWKYSLGSFQDNTTKSYDNWVCLIRTLLLIQLVITNSFIVAGNIRHWNDAVPVDKVSTISPIDP